MCVYNIDVYVCIHIRMSCNRYDLYRLRCFTSDVRTSSNIDREVDVANHNFQEPYKAVGVGTTKM